jgi:phosphoglycolate phosphatase
MPNHPRVEAILFDLDGTLADTAPDMANALNILSARHNKPLVDYELIRKNTSRGSIGLIQLGFEEPPGEPLEEKYMHQLRDEFLQIYAENLCIQTTLFPGVIKLLDFLYTSKIPWGIVTNKPGNLAEPLIQALGLSKNTACLVSGDSLSKRKPDPDQLHHAANIIGIDEHNTIYMGDDPRDIIAGKAANMKTAIAAYGYIQDNHDPLTWEADVIFHQALELKDWLFRNS